MECLSTSVSTLLTILRITKNITRVRKDRKKTKLVKVLEIRKKYLQKIIPNQPKPVGNYKAKS